MSDLIPLTPLGEETGYLLVEDQDRHRFWVSPKALTPGQVGPPLTQAQIDRIRAFKAILQEHEPTPLEKTLANFCRDRHPDREIQLWERIARVYQLELAARPEADAAERALVYQAIFACAISLKVNAILSMLPAAKALKHLDRLVARYAET